MSFHFSHPKHPLVLKEDIIVGKDAVCYGCNKSVVGFPTFTCDHIGCRSFYLHKTCAELPPQITHILMHRQHPLLLVPSLTAWSCNICKRIYTWDRFTYRCDFCDFDVCLTCASQSKEERTIQHVGHSDDHYLALIQREALFKCDACGVKAEESSYKCTTCEFWIHKSCASMPDIIPTPTHHHHPLHLIFSIPEMHRTFKRFCSICEKLLQKSEWSYYCHKCTYFVHMKCAAKKSMTNEIQGDCLEDEPDLLQIPLPSEDSLLDLIIQQVRRFQGEGSTSSSIASPLEHRSHREHQLELVDYSTRSSSSQILDSDDEEEHKQVVVCDGCIQPITAAHPSYYACLQCCFFLHSFCATKLPSELPAGACPSHPQHTLSLNMKKTFYRLSKCGACNLQTNGFFYRCKTCGFVIDIVCAFLPTRIRCEFHKHHPLVKRAFTKRSLCSVSKVAIEGGMEYGCETCNNFQIHMVCVFRPSWMRHKYDPHSIKLRNPPFFYEGVIYCEICEEEANNQWWLYHCGECDHSFHPYCLRSHDNLKTGGRIVYAIENQPHTLTLVVKGHSRKTPLYYCTLCGNSYSVYYFLECDGCGLLMCRACAIKIFG